jgi:hypothetical protein
MKNAVFSDITPCGSCKNIVVLCSVRRLLVMANVASSSQSLVTLMMEALRPPKRWFLQGTHDLTSQKPEFIKRTIIFIYTPIGKSRRRGG